MRRPIAKSYYRWFQFDLRTLFVLVLLVAVPLGWRQYSIISRERLARRVRAAGAIVWTRGYAYFDVTYPYDHNYGSKPFREVLLPPGTDERAIRLLAPLGKCRRAILRGTSLADSALADVTRLEGLEFLDLTATSITDRGVEQLQSLSSLEELVLDHTGLTDKAVDALSRLERLKSLSVRGSHITQAAVQTLVIGRPQLRVAWATALSDAHRQAAAQLEGSGVLVEAVRTHHGQTKYSVLVDARLRRDSEWLTRVLKTMHELEVAELTLHGVTLTDREQELLADCDQLQDLELEEVVVRGEWRTLAQMQSLRSLKLSRCAISSEACGQIGLLSALEELSIAGPKAYLHWDGDRYDRLSRFNDDGLAQLKGLRNLRRLSLRGMAASKDDLGWGKRGGQSDRDVQISDSGLAHLAAHRNLESLNLSRSPVTAEGLLALRPLDNLRELILIGVSTDAKQRAELCRAFPRAEIVFDRSSPPPASEFGPVAARPHR